MMTMIESSETTEYATYITATCGNKTATVTINKTGEVWVCCHNAAHKVWRGFGKRFESLAEAMKGYKSAEMKSIIAVAGCEA